MSGSPPEDLVSFQEVAAASAQAPPPDSVIPYGPHPLQFGHLRLPPGALEAEARRDSLARAEGSPAGPPSAEDILDRDFRSDDPGLLPVVVFIHGGCWLAEYDIAHAASLEVALAREGYAVWSLEYRRVGDEGGGWPHTFLDVAAGVDHVRRIAQRHRLDLGRVVLMGHSAGGQLALWSAARAKIRPDSELFTRNPLEIRGVLALAPAADLETLAPAGTCDDAVRRLMGGLPDEVPERYAAASPMALAPIPVPQTLILGRWDEMWTPPGEAYARRAREAGGGDWVQVVEAPASGHFDMIAPGTSTWDLVLEALEEMMP